MVHTLNPTYAGGKQLQYPEAKASMWPRPPAVRVAAGVIRAAGAAIGLRSSRFGRRMGPKSERSLASCSSDLPPLKRSCQLDSSWA
jgi:hypothetical protein